MNASPELGPTTLRQGSPKHDYHHQNGPMGAAMEYQHYGGAGGANMEHQQQQHQQQQQQDLTIDGIPNNFPHRRSRASRTFKNPPQPHMCIKEKTLDGKEVFINVLSWTRIANPDNPDAPIPLYGGMKVGKMPPGSPKVPPLVYAVMASPEVLKKAGRKCPDTPERMNLVDLMCEFVEAMNPSLHLSKKPEILKDRDLSGELKDVWSAVQACRDKGRSDNGPPENLVVYTEFGPDSAPSYEQTIHQQQQQQQQAEQHYQQQQQEHQEMLEQEQQQLEDQYEQECLDNYQSMFPQTFSTEVQLSAINSQMSEVRAAIEQRSASAAQGADFGDGGTNGILTHSATSRPPASAVPGSGNGVGDEELAKQTESLKLSSSAPGGAHRTNGQALPADGANSSQPPATATTVTSTSSSSIVPQTQTSPTNAVPATTVATTTTKESTKSSSGHTFFPMFRSSKSSNSSNAGAGGNNTNGNGASGNAQQHHNAPSDKGVMPVVNGSGEPAGTAADTASAESPKATKPASKKSGLYFFRRNKSSSSDGGGKKEPSTPTKQQPAVVGAVGLPAATLSSAASGPATPAATGATGADTTTTTKLIYQYPDQYHLETGGNGPTVGGTVASAGGGVVGTGSPGGGPGDIIETASSATIVAK